MKTTRRQRNYYAPLYASARKPYVHVQVSPKASPVTLKALGEIIERCLKMLAVKPRVARVVIPKRMRYRVKPRG